MERPVTLVRTGFLVHCYKWIYSSEGFSSFPWSQSTGIRRHQRDLLISVSRTGPSFHTYTHDPHHGTVYKDETPATLIWSCSVHYLESQLLVWSLLPVCIFFSLNSSFIEISFTDHTIYLLKVHNSVGFSIFRVVQPSLQSNSGIFSLPPKETPYPMQSLPIPSALGGHQSTFCLCGFSYSGHFLLYGIIQYAVLCVWLHSCSMMFSRCIHVMGCIWTSFNPLYCQIFTVWIQHILLIL